ncbi:MAG: phosphotransferase [Gammaproteobacteria bacterium]|nr:phosphotransferase [Gammaproteobacteria bacterium]
MDKRYEQLKGWLAATLDAAEYEIQPASADASFRRYFRVFTGGQSFIVMDAPPEKENVGPFIEIAGHLLALGLHVPEIFYQDLEQGFLLLSDLGSRPYLDELGDSTVERLYGDALGALVVLQAGIYTDDDFLPEYSAELLMSEMELFRDWYLGEHHGLALSASRADVLREAFELLRDQALAQTRVWVHRDYHSRNLMICESHNPGIIDFQDAVIGPVTYDLVSLLRDCYIAWPRERVEDWVKGYHQLAMDSGIPVCEDDEEFLRWFDWMGVQRHLKAIGIFARLNHRDGKPGYLKDIPRTLAYVLDVCQRYPELESFYQLLDELDLPEAA